MLNESSTESESSNQDETKIDSDLNINKGYDNSIVEKTEPIKPSHEVRRFSGNIQNDIINLMSLKPDQFQFSFTGLRRSLGIHQQQLVNTIDRLLEDSVLHKTQDGYFLSPEMRNQKQNQDGWNECETWSGKRMYTQPISIQKIYRDLYGKWYGKNRFLGGVLDSKNDKIVLEWVHMNNPSSQTRLEVSSFKVCVKFKNVKVYDRDKALNVFSESFISTNNPIMFEDSHSYMNN